MPHFAFENNKVSSVKLPQLPLSIAVCKLVKGATHHGSPTVLPHIPAMVTLEALAYLA